MSIGTGHAGFSRIAAAALTVAVLGIGGPGQAVSPVTGEYVCVSMGARPCDTHVMLHLQDNGFWGWAKYSGQYQVANGNVEFSGSGGPVAWGPAAIGAGTVTFNSGGQAVVWRRR
jgi:hypothetical protein